MENKYYTPDIKDLRIGYELYWIKDPIKEITDDNLIHQILDYKKLAFILNPPLKWKGALEPNLMSYLVPYLTKEQLEAEGWEFKESYYFLVDKYQKSKYLLFFIKESNTISLEHESRQILFKGKCPSINEFRTICKLLNIK
jgi:hypothetical protein